MALSSNVLPLGTTAPDFTLPDTVSGDMKSLNELKSDTATVIMFICNHCPYVIHVQQGLVKLANDYIQKGVTFIAINANDAESYPEDSPENMKKVAGKLGYPFPYLFDESQDVAQAYDAQCTPEFYIYDKSMKLVYHGQMDDSRPNSGIPVTGRDIRVALDTMLAGKPVDPNQKPSIGCSLKWKR